MENILRISNSKERKLIMATVKKVSVGELDIYSIIGGLA